MPARRPLLALVLACGCGPSTPDSEAPPGFEFQTPRLDTVTPGEIALGDRFRVFGADFLDPEYGSMRLRFEGAYTDETGQRDDYVGDLPLEVKSSGIAEAELDRLHFSPSGDRIGTFEGKVTVISRLEAFDDPAGEGPERNSDVIKSQVVVLPSIDVQALHSVDRSGCPLVTKATIGDSNLALRVRALGLGSASPSQPFTFRIGFTAPTAKVRYVANTSYSTWPITEELLTADVAAWAPDGNNTMELPATAGNVLWLDPRSVQTVVRINRPVTIKQQLVYQVLLQRLATGTVPDSDRSSDSTFVIEAITPDGQTAHRVVNLKVWKEWEAKAYNGNVKLKERYQAEQVSGCFPGGDIGRDLSYSESESSSRTRSMSARFDSNVANSVGANLSLCPICPVGGGINWQSTYSQTFGMDVGETVSSEMSRSLNLSAHILPSYFGTCYRQLEQLEREVDIVYHNACGGSGVIGQAVLTDWNFSFDIATGPQCPPPSNLPPADMFE